MPDIARVVTTFPNCSTSINPNLHEFMTWSPVYPSADLNSATPVRVAYNAIRGRYEAIASGGVALVSNAVPEAIVHGFTGAWVKFAVGPNATATPIFLECEFGNYSTNVTTAIFQAYVSNLVAGALNDTAAFAGQLPVALRFGFTPNAAHLGDKLYVNANGARFGV